MLRSYRILLPLLALMILIAGCGKPEDKFIGSYVGKQQLSQKAIDMINKSPMAAQLKDQIDKMAINLTLNKDKTAVLSATGQKTTLSGTWSYDNKQVVVNFSSPQGAGQPMKLNPSPDGKSLTADTSAMPGAGQYGSLVFTKS